MDRRSQRGIVPLLLTLAALLAPADGQDGGGKPGPRPERPKGPKPGAAKPKPDGSDDARIKALIEEGKAREALGAIDRLARAGELSPALLVLRAEAKLDLGRVADARQDLEKAQKDAAAAPKARVQLARIEFLHGRDDKARAFLEGADPEADLTKQLPVLIDGPFKGKLGDAARSCRGKSRDGRYLVYTDLGLDEAAIEKAIKKAKELREKGGPDVESRLNEAFPPTDGVKQCGRLMDTIARAYAAVFPIPKDEALLSRVYVFGSRDGFLAFSEAIGEDMSGADGFYAPDTRILAIDAEPDEGQKDLLSPNAKDTMFHEGFHQYVRFYVPQIPSWFDEGLAEYFGPSRLVGKGELEIGVVPKHIEGRTTRWETITRALRDRKPVAALPLQELLSKEQDDFAEGDRGDVNYAQAWSVVHFLLSNEKGKGLAGAYWKALRAGKDPGEAFKDAFGKEDLGELERDWKKHVQGL